MNARAIIETWWAKHDPHPGLYVIVKLRIYARKKEPWSEYDSRKYTNVTVKLEVPESIPFEDINGWIRNRCTSEGFTKWWNEYQAQKPDEAGGLVGQDEEPGIAVLGIVGYVDAEGRPYNTQPLQNDRVKRWLVQPDVQESEPEDLLFVKLNFGVNIWVQYTRPDNHNLDTEGPYDIIVPVKWSEFDQVKDPTWWDANGEERMDERFKEAYPEEYAAIIKKAEDEMVDISYETFHLSFVDYFGNELDVNSPDFQRNRVNKTLLGEDHMPHPDLYVSGTVRVCKVYGAAPDGEEYWISVPMTVFVPASIPFEEIKPWLDEVTERSMPANQLFRLFQEQHPDIATTLDPRMTVDDPPFIYFDISKPLQYVHGDGSPYDTFYLQRDRVSRKLIDSVVHHPHPDLNVTFTVTVGGPFGSPMNQARWERWRMMRLTTKVPEDVPFEKIPDWLWSWNEKGISSDELWELTQAQHPNVAKNLIVRNEVTLSALTDTKTPTFYFEEEGPLVYTHSDGTPYDTAPLQKDRLGRLLDQ